MGKWHDFNGAITILTTTATLFFMLSLYSGLAFNSLTIGNLRQGEFQLGAKLTLHPVTHNFQMHLPYSGQQNLTGLLLPGQTKRLVFIKYFSN